MIRNIVFDMGNVLIDYNPQYPVDALMKDPSDRECVLQTIFRSPEWLLLDGGTMHEEEALNIWLSRLPRRLHDDAISVFTDWHLYMPNINNMTQLVAQLKNRGLNLFILSNASVRFNALKQGMDAFKYMDGYIVSAFCKALKPQKEIYEILFKTYALKPEECFFIDDAPLNVAGAKMTGMDGHVFNGDIEMLKIDLWNRLGIE